MPTYDYQCSACGHAFEEFHGINEAPLKKCPKCKKQKLERLIGTGGAVLFKGTGFYTTDYRSSSYKSGEKSEAAPCSGTPATCPKPDCGSKPDA